jgi:hypothetical protein
LSIFSALKKKRNKTFEPIVELFRGYRSDYILFPDSDNDSESKFEGEYYSKEDYDAVFFFLKGNINIHRF